MASIKSMAVDSKLMQDGTWVELLETGGMKVLTRGLNSKYIDAQAARQRKAAKALPGGPDTLPFDVKQSINIECLIAHVLIDCKDVDKGDDAKTPILFPEFCDYLRNPDYRDLATACFVAAQSVGRSQADDTADAVGNSPAPSGSTWSGPAIGT